VTLAQEARPLSGPGARAAAAGVVLLGLLCLAGGWLQDAWAHPSLWPQAWPAALGLAVAAWLARRQALAAAWGDPAFVLGLGLGLAVALSVGLAWLQCSAVLDGRRWWWLEDDAMVSMRYGARLAQGLGLTWTEGPRVEGYSNWLWTLGMALVQRLGAPPASASAWVLAACVACLAWLGLATAALARALGADRMEGALAGCAVALSFDQMAAALSGMESVAVAAVAAQALAWTAAARARGSVDGRALALAACLPLLRADGALPALLVLALAWTPGLGWRRAAAAAALVLGPGLLQLAWRHGYYGAWLPNTYVLKSGAWAGKWSASAEKSGLALLRYPLALAACGLAWRRPGLRPWLLALLLLLAYTVWTGADYFLFLRFFAAGWPLFFALAFAGLGGLGLGGARRAWAAWAILLLGCNAGWALPQLTQLGWAGAKERLQVALTLRNLVAPQEKVAAAWAGTFYYYSGVQGVDLLGKCDAVVAAGPPSLDLEGPGHNKMNLAWSLGVLKPRWVLMETPPYSEADQAYVLGQYDLRMLEDPLFRGHCLKGARQLTDHWALCDCDWARTDGKPKKGKT
jgi:hypothetical protein